MEENNTLEIGFFGAAKVVKEELFDFGFITLSKREGKGKAYKIQLSKEAKELFNFDGNPRQQVAVHIDSEKNIFKLVNLGQSSIENPAILSISATGTINDQGLYGKLSKPFGYTEEEDNYLKVVSLGNVNIPGIGDNLPAIQVVAMPEKVSLITTEQLEAMSETIDEELAREDEVANNDIEPNTSFEKEDDFGQL